jgi:secreted trypsin-like serine protease
VYPTWDWGAGTDLQGDIAVLWLTKPVYTIPNIMTPMAGLKRVPMGQARIAGWGWTSYPWDQPDSPRYLSELDTQIVDPSHCAAVAIDAGEVCVADLNNPDGAACFGDSGGPVMVRVPHLRSYWYLIGTASRETATPCAGPVVYTSVLFFRDWINRTINGTYKAPKPTRPTQPANPAKLPGYRWAGCGTAC